MKIRYIALLAANFGNALFFSFILTDMLVFGGALHQMFLFEPSITVIALEVVVVWCIVAFDIVWILHSLLGRDKVQAAQMNRNCAEQSTNL